MPKRITTNVQLQQLVNRMCIPYFKGIFIIRTTLSMEEACQNESANLRQIANLDNAERSSTHWVCENRELRHLL